jgi:hypothetical protein
VAVAEATRSLAGPITIGVDIGQKRDPTAIAVAEIDRRRKSPARTEDHYLIRHLERLPLGTPYPEAAQWLARVAAGVRNQTNSGPTLYVDATGVGQPVLDLMRDEGVGSPVYGVYFTHGDRRTKEGRQIILGKAYLVTRLQTLLQAGRIHLPRTAEAEVLAAELLDYEIHVEPDANDHYGAFRVGTHDDLVTALGLAVHCEPRQKGATW